VQLAYLSDNTPAFKPSQIERSAVLGLGTEVLGSFRYEVAVRSRDGTAQQRWEWLTQREEDRPGEKALGRLAQAWFANDYQDAANWIRSLPAGADREHAIKEVIQFLERNGERSRIAEWK
jgi:hypothetical protein